MIYFEKIKAMGTDVEFFLSAEDKNLAEEKINWLKKTLENFENQFSRFINDSELSKFNDLEKGDFSASSAMIDILKKCSEFHEITDGVFDPTIAGALENLGYDKNFDLLSKNLELPNFNPAEIKKKFSKKSAFGELIVNGKKSIVKKPENFQIDFGGIGKGYIVDFISNEFKKHFNDFWISAGGDIFLSGKNNGKNWQVNIQNPFDLEKNSAIMEIKKEKTAVATSGISKRNWSINGINFHHIIDTRSGLPAENDVLSTTVIADSAASADVFAKSVVIMGIEKGIDFINKQNNAECLIIDKGFNFHFSENMRENLWII